MVALVAITDTRTMAFRLRIHLPNAVRISLPCCHGMVRQSVLLAFCGDRNSHSKIASEADFETPSSSATAHPAKGNMSNVFGLTRWLHIVKVFTLYRRLVPLTVARTSKSYSASSDTAPKKRAAPTRIMSQHRERSPRPTLQLNGSKLLLSHLKVRMPLAKIKLRQKRRLKLWSD